MSVASFRYPRLGQRQLTASMLILFLITDVLDTLASLLVHGKSFQSMLIFEDRARSSQCDEFIKIS